MATSGTPESPDMMVRFMQSGEIFTPSAPIDNQALFQSTWTARNFVWREGRR
jgi:hypothetical protein